MIRVNICRLLFVLLTASLVLGNSPVTFGFDYIIYDCPGGVCNVPVYPVPAIPRPAKGQSIQDPNFHTTITRISDKNIDQYWGRRMLNIYSTVDIENMDNTKLILTSGKFYVYDANTFELIRGLSLGYGGDIPSRQDLEARWDDEDPNIFYYRMDMKFYQYDVVSGTSTLIRDFHTDFPDGAQILDATKGAPSMDKRYWAFSVKQGSKPYHMIAAFTYDLATNRILNRIDPSENHRYVTMSPYGDRAVVSYYWPGQVTSYDLDFGNPVEIGTLAHTDYALTADGRQVRVFMDPSNDVIAMMDLITGERTNLLDLPLTGDWNTEPGGYHISGVNYDTPGWVLVSTYGTVEKSGGTWPHNLLFMLELKANPRIWLIAHTHCPQAEGVAKDYWAEAFATINKKGTKIFWGSNWDNPGSDTQIEAYQATLPENWYSDLNASSQGSPAAPSDFRIHW